LGSAIPEGNVSGEWSFSGGGGAGLYIVQTLNHLIPGSKIRFYVGRGGTDRTGQYGNLGNNPFSCTAGSPYITVSHTAHGLIEGRSWVSFLSQDLSDALYTSAGVNLNYTFRVFTGTWPVTKVIDANTYQVYYHDIDGNAINAATTQTNKGGTTPPIYWKHSDDGEGSWAYVVDNLAPVTISIADPAVVTWNNHGRVANEVVVFSTTGSLPTGLLPDVPYFVDSPTTNTFQLRNTATFLRPQSRLIATTGSQSGIHSTVATLYAGGGRAWDYGGYGEPGGDYSPRQFGVDPYTGAYGTDQYNLYGVGAAAAFGGSSILGGGTGSGGAGGYGAGAGGGANGGGPGGQGRVDISYIRVI